MTEPDDLQLRYERLINEFRDQRDDLVDIAAQRDRLSTKNTRLGLALAQAEHELGRQRVIVRAAEALVECDAAKPGLGQSISVWRRQRRELLDTLAAAVRAARPEGETE